jgi:hypothetical protein
VTRPGSADRQIEFGVAHLADRRHVFPMRRIPLVVVALLGCSSLLACAGVMKPDPYAPTSGDIATGAAGVPDVRCAGAPSTGPARGFARWRHSLITQFSHADHRGIDLIATTLGEQVLRGKLGYGTLDKALDGEDVELFACMAGSWQQVGTARTDAGGRFSLALDGARRLPVGLRDMYMSTVADRSGARFLAFVAPPGTPMLVSDVDGTLTASESAFVKAVFIGANVDPHPGAADSLREAAARGYQIVYLTARGDRFTDETRHWLGTHGFPRGPLRLVPALIVKPGAATIAYKQRVLRGLDGFHIAAGVGNRKSDVAAYAAAGVPAERIFVKLPEYNGELGTALRAGAAVGFGAYGRIPLP